MERCYTTRVRLLKGVEGGEENSSIKDTSFCCCTCWLRFADSCDEAEGTYGEFVSTEEVRDIAFGSRAPQTRDSVLKLFYTC